jgi:hypothetical protein
MNMTMNTQRFPLHRVAFARDRYGFGKVADVGSVS